MLNCFREETVEFSDWLQAELNRRGWDQAELARRSGLGTGTISRIMNGDRNAGPDFCIAVAQALRVPREEVFRARGWLRREPELVVPPGTDGRVAVIAERLNDLPDGVRDSAADAIEGMLDAVYSLARPQPGRVLVDTPTPYFMVPQGTGVPLRTRKAGGGGMEPGTAEQAAAFEAEATAWLAELDAEVDPALKAWVAQLREMKRTDPAGFRIHLQAANALRRIRGQPEVPDLEDEPAPPR